MLETMAFAVPAVLVLLVLDALTGGRRRAQAGSSAAQMLQGVRVLNMFLLAGALAAGCRVPDEPAQTVLWMCVFGVAGLAAIAAASAVGLALLRGLGPAVAQGNVAAATTAAAHVAAIGILVANVCAGTSAGDLAVAAVAFAVGQATLLALVWMFRWLTSYDDRTQILGGNVAAALSHGGVTIAMALLIANASDAEYAGAWPAVREYAIALAEGLLVYPVRQLVVQCLILRARPTLWRGELDLAIGERADVGAGALEAATYVAAAFFVRSLA
jgi:uncharacterized membrane protein YjfL (UPF0719 family)